MPRSSEENIQRLVRQVGENLSAHKLKLCSAESCTGGWIAQVVTSIPGCSSWFDTGFVTYSNQSKKRLLQVPGDLLEPTSGAPGAVSEQVVLAMAAGALQNSDAQVAVATSGVAGPEGGSDEKPVGTVWIGWSRQNHDSYARQFHFEGDRYSVRVATVEKALEGLLKIVTA
ncbi:MAG: CinA family protein [Pseudohongiellaceae bacterium]